MQSSLVCMCVCGGGDCMPGLHVVFSCSRGVRNQLCVVALCMWFNLLTTAAGMSVNQSWHRHHASGWTEESTVTCYYPRHGNVTCPSATSGSESPHTHMVDFQNTSLFLLGMFPVILPLYGLNSCLHYFSMTINLKQI